MGPPSRKEVQELCLAPGHGAQRLSGQALSAPAETTPNFQLPTPKNLSWTLSAEPPGAE